MKNVVLHLDMDSFFASCHQQGNPFLRNKPIAVIGNFRGDKASRSVIAAASKEAKKFGITSGMPLFKAEKLCPEIIFIEADEARYGYISNEVFKIMAKYGEDLKILSIDEAALKIQILNIKNQNENSKFKIYDYVKETAIDMKKEIKTKLGEYLTCSIGISYNYVLAKLASDLSKPNGLKIITEKETPKLLKNLAIDKIAGIGKKTKEKLSLIGIKNFSDLKNAPEFFLKRHFGIFGLNLKNISFGGDSFYYKRKQLTKSVSHSETFISNTINKNLLHQYLQKLSEKVAFRLREKNLEGNIVNLTVRLKDFTTFSKQKKLNYFTFDGYDIFKETAKILDNLQVLVPIRLLGVSVSGLQKSNQYYLFRKYNKRKKFLRTCDKVKKIFGHKKIFPLAIKNLLQ